MVADVGENTVVAGDVETRGLVRGDDNGELQRPLKVSTVSCGMLDVLLNQLVI